MPVLSGLAFYRFDLPELSFRVFPGFNKHFNISSSLRVY